MRRVIIGLLVVREEDGFLMKSLAYHKKLGFDMFHVILHRATSDIASKLKARFGGSIRVLTEDSAEFHQRELQQSLVRHCLDDSTDDWIFFLDADEFIWVDGGLPHLLKRLEKSRIDYASLNLFDMLHDLDNNCPWPDPCDAIFGFFPFKERSWEQPSSFYKSFCKMHVGLEVFQGGHLFTSIHHPPYSIPAEEAKIFHYTNKGSPEALLKKWRNLSESRLGQVDDPKPVWWEKYQVLQDRVLRYEGNLQLLLTEWFREPKTFWGTPIPQELIIRDDRMKNTLKALEE